MAGVIIDGGGLLLSELQKDPQEITADQDKSFFQKMLDAGKQLVLLGAQQIPNIGSKGPIIFDDPNAAPGDELSQPVSSISTPSILDRMLEAGKSAIDTAISGVKSAGSATASAAKGTFSTVTGGISNVWNTLTSAVRKGFIGIFMVIVILAVIWLGSLYLIGKGGILKANVNI